MENLLRDQREFEKVTLKNDTFLNFKVNPEKRIFKNPVDFNSMSKEMRKLVKPVGTTPGIMYENCKVHKQQVDGCSPFRPILSALQTSIYNLAKFLVPILNDLDKIEYTVKDSFQCAEEICEQDPTLTMGSLNVDSLFTNIPLDETIVFASISSLKTLILLNVLKSQNLNNYYVWLQMSLILYLMVYISKQIDGVAMGSPLGPYLLEFTSLLMHFCHTLKKTG